MVRFFVSPEDFSGGIPALTGENARHAKVLRLQTGEEVLLCDGNGKEWVCLVREALPARYLLDVLETRDSTAEAAVRVSVYMAFPKADKLEHVIQKATELGASEIVAFPSARCVSRPDERSLAKKLDRWQKIAASAAEQSGRGRTPDVDVLPSYAAALARSRRCRPCAAVLRKRTRRDAEDGASGSAVSFGQPDYRAGGRPLGGGSGTGARRRAAGLHPGAADSAV